MTVPRDSPIAPCHPSTPNPTHIALAQIEAGGQAETVAEERLDHAAAHACAGVEDGLPGVCSK
jgi:hypothetical protein